MDGVYNLVAGEPASVGVASTATEPMDNMSDAEWIHAMRDAIKDYVWYTYEDSKSQLEPERKKWRRAWRRYRSQYVEKNETSALADLNTPKLAKICDLFSKRLMQLTVPDKHRLDFVQLSPAERYMVRESAMADTLQQYSRMAGIVLRQDLRECRFVESYGRMLLDLVVTGNMRAMVHYDQNITYKFERMENPEYRFDLPAEMNYRYDVVNGEEVKTPIEPYIEERVAHREYDAPAVRYLNPMNVYPSEPDKHDISECSMVCIYDTVRKADLLEDEIDSGGSLYVGLEQLKEVKESPDTPEVDDRWSDSYDRDELARGGSVDQTPQNDAARKLGRITAIGIVDIDEIAERRGLGPITDNRRRALFRYFGGDERKLKGWRTFITEIVGEKLIRFQPSPFYRDAINVIGFGLFAIPNQVTADGCYTRGESHESIFNAMQRYGLELTLKMVRPMVGVIESNIDPVFYQLCEGKLGYEPDRMIPLKPGSTINDTLQLMQLNPTPLAAIGDAKREQEREMSELTHHPNVKQGTSSGGNTATEVAAMNQNSDVVLDEVAQMLEIGFLHKMLEWMLEMHHQFSEEPKVVNAEDEEGRLSQYQIPPQVWLRRYHVNMMGFRQTGNYAVRAQAFEKFMALAERTGRANMDEFIPEYGRILQVQFPKRFLAPPPPPAPPEVKGSGSIALKQELCPPVLVAELVKSVFGIDVTPETLAAMGAIKDAADKALMMEQAAPVGESGPPGAGGGGGNGSGDNRNHHAVGEYTPSRGLGDEVGIQKSMGQANRNPNNSRAATAI
jgi:hypothetical protein